MKTKKRLSKKELSMLYLKVSLSEDIQELIQKFAARQKSTRNCKIEWDSVNGAFVAKGKLVELDTVEIKYIEGVADELYKMYDSAFFKLYNEIVNQPTKRKVSRKS